MEPADRSIVGLTFTTHAEIIERSTAVRLYHHWAVHHHGAVHHHRAVHVWCTGTWYMWELGVHCSGNSWWDW